MNYQGLMNYWFFTKCFYLGEYLISFYVSNNVPGCSLVASASTSISVTCPDIVVRGADYANCNGVYNFVNDTYVTWAPERPVYKHKTKNR